MGKCKSGTRRNPETGRCKKPCGNKKIINPKTGRCVTKKYMEKLKNSPDHDMFMQMFFNQIFDERIPMQFPVDPVYTPVVYTPIVKQPVVKQPVVKPHVSKKPSTGRRLIQNLGKQDLDIMQGIASSVFQSTHRDLTGTYTPRYIKTSCDNSNTPECGITNISEWDNSPKMTWSVERSIRADRDDSMLWRTSSYRPSMGDFISVIQIAQTHDLYAEVIVINENGLWRLSAPGHPMSLDDIISAVHLIGEVFPPENTLNHMDYVSFVNDQLYPILGIAWHGFSKGSPSPTYTSHVPEKPQPHTVPQSKQYTSKEQTAGNFIGNFFTRIMGGRKQQADQRVPGPIPTNDVPYQAPPNHVPSDVPQAHDPPTHVPSEAPQTQAPTGSISAKDHPVYKKFFNMLKVGIPREAALHAMAKAGLDQSILDDPDAMLPLSTDNGNTPETHSNPDLPAPRPPVVEEESSDVSEGFVVASEHPDYKKFFKMLKMGTPRGAALQAMAKAGLDQSILDDPTAMLPFSTDSAPIPPSPPVASPPTASPPTVSTPTVSTPTVSTPAPKENTMQEMVRRANERRERVAAEKSTPAASTPAASTPAPKENTMQEMVRRANERRERVAAKAEAEKANESQTRLNEIITAQTEKDDEINRLKMLTDERSAAIAAGTNPPVISNEDLFKIRRTLLVPVDESDDDNGYGSDDEAADMDEQRRREEDRARMNRERDA